MVDENKIQADAAAEAPAKVAVAVAETAEKVVAETVKVAKRARATTARRAKRQAAKTIRAPRKSARRVTSKTRAAGARKAATAARNERIDTVNFQTPRGFFDAAPVAAPFQALFAEAGERGQEVARRSQKAAEGIADLARENVEAIVESGRIAAEGARSLGQDLVATTRNGVEQAADAVRTLAEAKSPTEFVQLQSELARASFDRMVAQSSRMTESFVKLAGEAFQPISNRASVNAERLNQFVA